MIGQTAGSYRITHKVSVGGMGTVYRGEHTLIGKAAAVKVLHPELTSNHDIVNRFFNEAKATTAIQHPGIVEVFDFGYLPSGHAYLVMEFLDGMSLARRIKERGIASEGEAAMVLRAVCSALAAAHAKGIVHRDLKPDNIFMVTDADAALGVRPKLLDFGIAKLTDIGLAGTATKTGAVMGTPTYMSPEQCKGTGDVDHRADLYSLGCILYELCAGRPPFTNLGAGELIGHHLFVAPEAPTGLTPETTALIMALLAKDPAQRPQTAKELGQRLTRIAQSQGWITASSPNAITSESLSDLRVSPSGPHVTPHRFETGGTPASFTPAAMHGTPAFGPTIAASSTGSHDEPQPKPTTISGATGQSVVSYPKRRGLGIAAAAAIILAAGGVTIGIAMSKSGKTVTPVKGVESHAIERHDPPAPTPAPPAVKTAPPEEPKQVEPGSDQPQVGSDVGSGSDVKVEPEVKDPTPPIKTTPPPIKKPTPVRTPPRDTPKKPNLPIETDI